MELVPLPVGGSDRGRAAQLRARLLPVLPVMLLVLVAGTAVLGQDPGAESTARAVDAAPPEVVSTLAPPTTSQPSPSPAATPLQVALPLPDEILGIRIQDVASARRQALERAEPGRLVAVSGWLTVAPGDPRCETNWYLACRRTGRLTSSRESDPEVLIVQTQPGVPLIGLQRQSPAQGTWTVHNRAVLIGRFGEPGERACRLPSLDCEPVFTIERLAWLRNAERQRPLIVGPGAITARSTAEEIEPVARASVPGGGETLMLGVLDWRTLRLIDAGAAEAAATVGPDQPVWYVRTVAWPDTAASRDATLGWAVLDDQTGRVLASGLGRASGQVSGDG